MDEALEFLRKRARRLWLLLWIGIAWSFFYTAISLFIMSDLSHRLEDTCSSRQAARTAIREVLLDAPYLSEQEQHDLDVNLPAEVRC